MEVRLEKVPKIVEYIERSGYNDIRVFEEKVSDELDYFYREEFKLKFLTEVSNEVESSKNRHIAKCPKKGDCFFDKYYREAEFFIHQEIDRITNDISIYGEFNRFNAGFIGEQFSEEEINSIHEKLDKIQLGQEAIYDDLQQEIKELKELIYVLNKKNWIELMKGKLSGFGINKSLSIAMKGTLDTIGFDNQIKDLL
ncbi:MAG: hypothetical protein RIC95_11975 [Vicingaceae bacterium]